MATLRKQADVPKTKPRVTLLRALVEGQLPEGRWIEPIKNEVAAMIDEAQRSPAWPDIADCFVMLCRAGISRDDPDVVRKVIARGEEIYEYSQQPKPERTPQGHEPIVYYFALGDLVKIGTSQNIARRAEAFNPQEILAIERGGYEHERQRHELFAPLLVHGEWFRHEDPLLSYIETTRAAFEDDFGMPMDRWLRERRVILPRVVVQDRD